MPKRPSREHTRNDRLKTNKGDHFFACFSGLFDILISGFDFNEWFLASLASEWDIKQTCRQTGRSNENFLFKSSFNSMIFRCYQSWSFNVHKILEQFILSLRLTNHQNQSPLLMKQITRFWDFSALESLVKVKAKCWISS